MKIQILGTGGDKCRGLAENAQRAAKAQGIAAEVEVVEDIREIAAMGIALTPALLIDGVPVSRGRLLSVAQIEKLLA